MPEIWEAAGVRPQIRGGADVAARDQMLILIGIIILILCVAV